MLHERRLPQAEADDLDLVYTVKLKFLTWLLRSPLPGQVTEEGLTALFGGPLDSWFWSRIWKSNKFTKFGKAVNTLAARSRKDADSAKKVADAIESDSKFHEQWDTPGFEFSFPRLYPGWLDVIKPVAEPFYDWLSGIEFKASEFGLKSDMSRMRIMAAYRPISHQVCGYCDGHLGDSSDTKEANDCEHFFPKSKWPHLAIHPSNLFASCTGCNRTWKLAHTPMGVADVAGLAGTYHPFLRAGADLITVNVGPSPDSPRCVKISITDDLMPERARTLNEVLALDERWTSQINGELDSNVSELVAHAIHTMKHTPPLTEEHVIEVLNSEIHWYRIKRGKKDSAMRLEAVLRYQKDNHLADILAEL